jgi:hypothetical protein
MTGGTALEDNPVIAVFAKTRSRNSRSASFLS